MRPTLYAYSRFSNASQAEGDSLRRQLKASIDFAERHNLQLDTTLRDHGVSGYTGLNRIKGALGSFIRRVEAGEIAKGSYLAVDSLDRFSRESETQVLNMLTTLTLAGIKVVNLAEDHVLDGKATTVDYIRVLIHAARSNQESVEKSRKVRLARQEERRRAREDGTPSTPVGPHWLKLVGGKWKPIPDRVAVVQRVFDLKEAGLGNQWIAKTFNKEGVRTPTGRGGWFNSTVASIATSAAVLGHYQPYTGHPRGKAREPVGEAITTFYPQIIEPDQFHRVQALIAARQNPNARPAVKEFPNLLVSLVSCSKCGGVVGFLRSTFPKKPGWKSGGALRCNGVARGLCDNRSRVPYAPLEAALLPFIASLPLAGPISTQTQDSMILGKEGERAALVAKIAALVDQAEGSKALGDRLVMREAELVALDNELSRLRSLAAQARAALPTADALNNLNDLRTAMETAVGEERYAIRAKINATLKTVVTGGFVMEPDGIIVARLAPGQVVGRMPQMLNVAARGILRWEVSNVPSQIARWSKTKAPK